MSCSSQNNFQFDAVKTSEISKSENDENSSVNDKLSEKNENSEKNNKKNTHKNNNKKSKKYRLIIK